MLKQMSWAFPLMFNPSFPVAPASPTASTVRLVTLLGTMNVPLVSAPDQVHDYVVPFSPQLEKGTEELACVAPNRRDAGTSSSPNKNARSPEPGQPDAQRRIVNVVPLTHRRFPLGSRELPHVAIFPRALLKGQGATARPGKPL